MMLIPEVGSIWFFFFILKLTLFIYYFLIFPLSNISKNYETGTMNACTDCPTGKQDNSDQSECDACTTGRVAANPGQSSCTACQAGTAAVNKAQGM